MRPNRSGIDWTSREAKREHVRRWRARQPVSERVEANVGATVKYEPTAEEYRDSVINEMFYCKMVRFV